MKILVAGGTGFVGQYLVRRYLQQGHTITVVGRSQAKIRQRFANEVEALDWNTLRQQGLSLLPQHDLIINLAGASIADDNWSKARQEEIINSRITPTEMLAKLCAQLKEHSPPLFNASAIGYYGLQKQQAKDLPVALREDAKPIQNELNFASRVVQRWEQATQVAQKAGVRVVLMRFGVVLGPNGGALAKLNLPFKLGLGGKIGSGKQPFSWISLQDLCRAIDFILPQQDISGPVNFVAPEAVSQAQFAKTFAKALTRPAIFPTPGFVLRWLYGQMAQELLLDGQNVYPGILKERGFIFNSPTLKKGLKYALDPKSALTNPKHPCKKEP